MPNYRFPCGCEFPILEASSDPDVIPLLDFDIEKIPETCSAVWEMLGRGDTKGIFQLESSLGRQWTKKLKPESLEHMGALGSLLRPGPLQARDADGISLTEHFVRRKMGLEEVVDLHPALKPILEKTYAVLCFQEQSMRIAKDLAGFDLVAVDRLRKGTGKKDVQLLEDIGKEFLAGCQKTGVVDDETAKTVWGWIKATGRYQFNKSHADSYGLRGYKTAYIKAHFPVAFFTSWLKYAKFKPDPQEEVFELVNDARLFDVQVEPPDILSLESDVHTDRKVVKFGLTNIKGIGEAQVQKLRDKAATLDKPLASLSWFEFLTCVTPSLSSSFVTRMAEVGALRCFKMQRQHMLAEYQAWASLTGKEQEWIRERLVDFPSLLNGLKALALPRQRKIKALTERVPKKGKEAEVARLLKEREELGSLMNQADMTAEVGESVDPEMLDELLAQVQTNERAYLAATKNAKIISQEQEYVGPFGGCANERREEVVRSTAQLLENPPSVIADSPQWIAYIEEQLLGISISCSKIDSCDISAVNCSCKEFLTGRTGFILLGVEVQQVREVKTKKGKTPGQKMAFLTVADNSCALNDVVVFPEAWKDFGHLLTQGNTVIIQGERDAKDKESRTLFVKKVWQAT